VVVNAVVIAVIVTVVVEVVVAVVVDVVFMVVVELAVAVTSGISQHFHFLELPPLPRRSNLKVQRVSSKDNQEVSR
jgi:hypothetical protein